MKKYFLLLMASACISVADAQLIKQNEEQKKQADLDWYNCSFDKDGVYGAEVNKAYDFLKGKKIKKRPVVALIGSGMDIEHEDLKQAIWVNPKEKADGKDNDKNGLVDDINGWNFLGGNAQPAVKDAADYITGTNDEDGLVEVIDKFIMNPEQA